MKRIDFRLPGQSSNFSRILRELKEQSGCALYDDSFEKWMWEECGIRQLHESEQFPNHLTGVEMTDEAYTMLLLRVNV